MKLKISNDLELPVDAVTRRLAWLGTIGSGKTYGVLKMVEEMSVAKAQVVIVDPVGVHWGIRLAADGKAPGISFPVFGGLHGDIPLEPTAGILMADLIVDKRISAVIDVSQFEYDTDKTRFCTDFANRFFFRKKSSPSAVHVVLEECQEFIPQNPQKGEEKMLHAFIRMWKIGRNFGIGGSLVSQRPQEINKKALNLSQCLFAFQTTGKHERKAIEEWILDKGLDLDIANDLPKLPVGTPHVWSPAWLGISKSVKIGKRVTFNASATPEVGEASVVKELAKIDIEKISIAMKETIEKSKENDPDELKKKIRQLQSELSKKNGTTTIKVVDDQAIEKIKQQYEMQLRKFNVQVKAFQDDLSKKIKSVTSSIGTLSDLKSIGEFKFNITQPPVGVVTSIDKKTFVASIVMPEMNGDVSLGKCSRMIAGFLTYRADKAWTKEQIGVMIGYSPNSGGFNNSLGELRTNGIITGSGNELRIVRGVPFSEKDFTIQNGISILGKCEREIAEVLLQNPGIVFTPEQVALQTVSGYSHSSGGFNNALGRLNTLGWREDIRGKVALSKEFIELIES